MSSSFFSETYTKEICPEEIKAMSRPPCKQTVAGIANCPVCGKKCCPICGRHKVVQLSRITGYIQDVEGWNEGKKQELKDRQRYVIGGSLSREVK